MHELLRVIKRAAIEAYENEQMIDLVCGRVTATDPLSVCVQGNTPVRLLHREGEPKLNLDDRVYLIRLRGGQRFLLLDKAVSV